MFINTLPIIFTYTNLLTPTEFFLGIVLVFLIVYVNTPTPHLQTFSEQTVIGHSIANQLYLEALLIWLGKARLWVAFWPFFILVNGLLYYIDYRISTLTFTIASWKTAHMMVAIPIIWWIISVWRCSHHTSYRLWSSAARTATLYLLFELTFRIIIVSFYPNTFFDCQLLVAHYGDCF